MNPGILIFQTKYWMSKYPLPNGSIASFLEAPPIPLEQAALLNQKMSKTCPNFPAPQVFQTIEKRHIKPIPILVLDALDKSTHHSHGFHSSNEVLFIAKIAFDYAGLRIAHFEECDVVVREQDSILMEYPRDKSTEAQKIEELHQVLPLRVANTWEEHQWQVDKKNLFVLDSVHAVDDLDALYPQVLPHLKATGWQIEFASPLYQEVIHGDEVEWFSDLSENHDFFSYQLGILVEGKTVNIVPLIAALIQQYKGNDLDNLADDQLVQLPLKDNRLLSLPLGRIKPLVRLLLQLGIRHLDENQPLEMKKYQIILMREAELAIAASKARWQGADHLRNALRQLIHLQELPEVTVPEGLNTQLRDYQQEGLRWLQFLRTHRFGGILADDMGLGKTVQT